MLGLESLERHWKFDARLLARWQADMRDVGAPNVQDASEIARRRIDWETKQAALTNWTLLDRNRRLDVDLGVGYGSDPARIIELLAQVASQTPEVAREPAPGAMFMGFGDSALNFAVPPGRAVTTIG